MNYTPVIASKKFVIPPERVESNWLEIEKQFNHLKRKLLISNSGVKTNNVYRDYLLNSAFDEIGTIVITKKQLNTASPILQEYFTKKWNDKYIRVVNLGSKFSLKGHMSYLSYLKLPLDLLLIKMFEEIEEIETVLNHYLKDSKDNMSYLDYILILAMLDNRKNHSLELLSASNQIGRITGQWILHKGTYEKLLTVVQDNVDSFYLTLIKGEVFFTKKRPSSSMVFLLKPMVTALLINKNLLTQKKLIIRKFREASNPLQNLTLALYAYNEWSIKKHFDSLVGVEYGGIELPFVMNSVMKLNHQPSLPIYLIKYSHYSNSTKLIRSSLSPFEVKRISLLRNKNVFILDDNVLTGITTKMVLEELIKSKINSFQLGYIGYSGSKRFLQMIQPGNGCVNPKILLNKAYIVTESPFNRLNINERKVGEQKQFNRIENKIIKHLIQHNSSFEYEKITQDL